MNRHERPFAGRGEAKLRYFSGEYRIVKGGDYVVCAVTGQHIPLTELRYWSARHQEAYVSAEVAVKRYAETGGEP